ncbi:MAG TPA: FecR family protein [Paucimonas sp.]|nr:FecR family protein [Paucimonas sp.]HJW54822.1 FecR family protein [Burkholderiaceae bacterium]
MHDILPARWVKHLLMICLTAASALAMGAELAGSVSFAIGEARVIGDDGKPQPVARGAEISAGQTLLTGANGHIHVRMVDGAFISVRPQSRLRIESYHYDAAAPANNRIKFVLEQGVARSITGRAGEAARENYRLNTPLAAIGIRGTDFVVQAAADVTRVTVQSGAIVMSPLTGNCLASTLGPCKSASARVLTAAMHDAYLELRSRNEAPLLVPAEKALESPNLLAPPRPEEPRVAGDKQSRATPSGDMRDAVREVAADMIRNSVDASNPQSGTPPVADVVTPPAPKYWWGRWANFIQPGQEASSLTAMHTAGREMTFGNEVFGLLREPQGDVMFPNAGVVRFQLAESEAYAMQDHKTLAAAQIASPSLTVDFGARRYDTSLTVNSAGNAPVAVQSSGQITFQGMFKTDASTSNTSVLGSLSNSTDQAGYIFQRDLANGLSVVGATRWTR